MGIVSRLEKNFRFTSIFKPLIYLIVFSVIYSFGLVWLSQQDSSLFSAGSVLWMAAYGLCVYFVCTLVWGRQRGTLSWRAIAVVLGWNVVWGIAVHLLSWAYNLSYGNMLAMLVVYAVSAAGLVFLVPYTLLVWRGLYKAAGLPDGGNSLSFKDLFTNAWQILISHFGKIVNSWLVLLLVIIFWDSMFLAPMGLDESMNLAQVFSNMIYYGAPGMYPVMLLMLSGGNLASGMAELALLFVLSGIVLSWFSLNMVSWISRFDPVVSKRKYGRKTKGSARAATKQSGK